jgi:hypothetical protein
VLLFHSFKTLKMYSYYLKIGRGEDSPEKKNQEEQGTGGSHL